MISSSCITRVSALAAWALVACTNATPDITIDVTRPSSTTTVNIEVCPTGVMPGSEFCTAPQELFAGKTELQRRADIEIGDNTVEVDAYLVMATACLEIDVLLEGAIVVTYSVGSAAPTCSPLSACTSTLMEAGCNIAP